MQLRVVTFTYHLSRTEERTETRFCFRLFGIPKSIATPPKVTKPKKTKRGKKQIKIFIKFESFSLFWPFEASGLSKSSPGGQIMLVDKI